MKFTDEEIGVMVLVGIMVATFTILVLVTKIILGV